MNIYEVVNNKFINIIKQPSTRYKLFIFGIGTYPHRPESNHENTKFYMRYKNDPRFDVYRILIDPDYKNQELSLDYDDKTIIMSESVEYREYYMILDFCNFASKFNCLSVIMEFTSIQRNTQFINLEKVYVTPSNCLANSETIAYNPIIIENDNSLSFYTPSNTNLYIELQYLTSNIKNNICMEKIEYMTYIIILNFLKINMIYRKMLCFMNVEEDFEMGFSKNHENFERSIQQLLYRMGGYYKNDAKKIIEQFKDNVSNDLRIYINDIIYNIFIDCLYLEKNGAIIENNLENIKFNNDNELKNLIDYYEKIFYDFIENNGMRLY